MHSSTKILPSTTTVLFPASATMTMSSTHEAKHHSHKKDGCKRKANRVQRACFNCRKRKQGCEEERPCRRCLERGIECVEVETKRKRGRAGSTKTNNKEGKPHLLSAGAFERHSHGDDMQGSPMSFDSISTGAAEQAMEGYEDEDSYSSSSELSESSDSQRDLLHNRIIHHQQHLSSSNNNVSPASDPSSPMSPEVNAFEANEDQQQQVNLSINSMNGLNLAHLLPFLGDILSTSKASNNIHGDMHHHQYAPSVWPLDEMNIDHNSELDSLFGFDFPFYTAGCSTSYINEEGEFGSSPMSSPTDSNISSPLNNNNSDLDAGSSENELSLYVKECWKEFLEKVTTGDDQLKREFSESLAGNGVEC